MRQPSLRTLQKQVDQFNEKFKPGDTVRLRLDSSEVKETKLRTEAQILQGHSAVAWFEGVSGCYMISRVLGKVVATDLQTINQYSDEP